MFQTGNFIWHCSREEMEPAVRLIATLDGTNLTCKGGPAELRGQLVSSLDKRQMTCRVAEDECPTNCTCHYRPSNSALLVDCSERGFTRIPESLPSGNETRKNTNHTELDLRGNQLTSLPDQLGEGYERVTKLYLAYNNLTRANLTSFNKNLQVSYVT